MSDWLNSSIEKKKQLKTCIFPPNCLNIAEFYFPKENEADLIKQFFIPVPEKIEEEDNKTKDNKKKEAAAKAKKDVKKDQKKPPIKKGAKEEPEKKIVPILDWPKLERDKIFVDKNNIITGLKDLLVNINLEII